MIEKLLSNNALVNALITAVISALVTNACMWWHKKSDYKREYYKKIIDKRLKAYEKLSNTIAYIDVKAYYRLYDETKLMYTCFDNLNALRLANKKIILLKEEMFWYSKGIYTELKELNRIFADLLDHIEEDAGEGYSWDIEKIIEQGFLLYNDIEMRLMNIKNISKTDISNLDDVSTFF